MNRRNDNVKNWNKVSNEITFDLRQYFDNHIDVIQQYRNTNDFIDKQTFGKILRSSGCLIDNNYLESLWNLCQPTDKGISYEMFCRHFMPLKNHQDSTDPRKDNNSSSKQCRILNYTTRIYHIVKQNWQNLKDEFSSLDRYGRLFITIDQAINLMKKYCFPLNDKQQCELALLFSPKKNGRFNYFDFMKYFTNQSSLNTLNQSVFSRSTHLIQSKQSWTSALITIDSILNRIRFECIKKYESIYRMFKIIDKNHQGYLTKIQFKQIFKQFNIKLDEEELYHIISEIDKNQDGLISYEELYYSLITDALNI